MRQTLPMGEPETAEDFWSRDELVRAYRDAGEALLYEEHAIADAATRARRSGDLHDVHVLGVGGGRELGAIRTLTAASHVYAWDISQPMVDACRAHVRSQEWPDVEVGRCAVADLARPDGVAADVVIALGAVLGYGTTPEERRRSCSVLAALLRPGGALAAVVQQRHGRPDWSLYFALRAVRERTPWRGDGDGNRRSRHGDSSVLFHHFGAEELEDLLRSAGFTEVDVRSLRSWGRANGVRIPLRSPNPLIVTATVAGT